MRLVAHIVRKYQSAGRGDGRSSVHRHHRLIKAVVTFNPDKAVRLGTYAARCIENEVLMYLRSRRKSSRDISLYEPIGTDREGNEIQLFDIIESDADDAHERAVLKDDVRLLYSRIESVLSPREQLVLKMRTAFTMRMNIRSGRLQGCLGSPALMSHGSKRAQLKSCGTRSEFPQLSSTLLFSAVYRTDPLCPPDPRRRSVLHGARSPAPVRPSFTIRRTVTGRSLPSGFMISICSPTENLFLCSMQNSPSREAPAMPRYVYSFSYVLLS